MKYNNTHKITTTIQKITTTIQKTKLTTITTRPLKNNIFRVSKFGDVLLEVNK
jgi:hypothetical protein